MPTVRPLLLTSLLLIGISPLATAEESSELHPSLTREFFLDVGMFFLDRHLTIGADGSAGAENRRIDFEEELRLKGSDQTFAVDFAWRYNENWFLFGQHFRSTANSSSTLRNDIPWKDIVFPKDSDVVVGSEFEVLGLTVGRKLETRERHEFGFAGGIQFIDIAAFIQGTAVDGDGVSNLRKETVTTAGPLPTIGAWYKYSISPKWAFKSRLDWIEADVDKYGGYLIDASAGLNYRLGNRIGVGLAYHQFKLHVAVDENSWRGQVYTVYQGLFVYFSGYW